MKWWLSFVDEETDTCRGVCIVETPDFLAAVRAARDHGCSPGGQVMGTGFPSDYEGPEQLLPLNTLLSREQLQTTVEAKSIREWNETEPKE